MRKFKVMDGNEAAAAVSYQLSDVAMIYPITPSSPMAEWSDQWSAQQKKNILGHPLLVTEMQSEAGAAAAMHGALQAGSLAVTYTSSQGLLLMIPNLYKMVGENLPGVFQVASRTVATSALSIFGDHSDVMAVRQVGAIMLCSNTVQEVMDLSPVAHYLALKAQLPVIHFFDGFQTSHELQKIQTWEKKELEEMFPWEDYQRFYDRRLSNERPVIQGSAQNSDIHFQQKELANTTYLKVEDELKTLYEEVNRRCGTSYAPVEYYGVEDATKVVIALGSVEQTIRQTVDYLLDKGEKVGMITIRLYRPFPAQSLMGALPKTVKGIAVLDRTKEPGSQGEPLLLDVQSVLYESEIRPLIIGGRYGLASKETTPGQILAVFHELEKGKEAKKRFTIGIEDDVTHLSLPILEEIDLTSPEAYQAKFWGFGSDGTVGAVKSALKMIGNETDSFVQGFFAYDSKKSGGLTVSHTRISNHPISSNYLVHQADLVACHNASYLRLYDMVDDLKENGIFLLNTYWNEEQVMKHLPKRMKKALAEKNAHLYIINAFALAKEVGLERKINTIMITSFFDCLQIFPKEKYIALLNDVMEKMYARKAKGVVEQNQQAIAAAAGAAKEVHYPKEEWLALEITEKKESTGSQFVDEIVTPMLAQKGDQLSVEDLQRNEMDGGALPLGTAAYEKRGIALEIPVWNKNRCIQCNECAFICPHAAIRPFVMDEEEKEEAPEGFVSSVMKGEDGLYYRIQVSLEDCTGCGLCVEACPAKGKALEMRPYEEQREQAMNWAFAMTLKQKTFDYDKMTIARSQLQKPLVEFSGACSGCGETSYVKLLTQLYGDRLRIANATGCSSIWGASAPTTPYTTKEDGTGATWSNSLLEDNAEFGYGMYSASKLRRDELAKEVESIIQENLGSETLRDLLQNWKDHYLDSEGTKQRATKLIAQLEQEKDEDERLVHLYTQKEDFVKPTYWLVGGDGWAYDIGFGGIDHVLASGADVNMLVLDNEVYSNTGGQTSKATPAAAIAKFSAQGKYAGKKDLGAMAMTYENVYVAQISLNSHPVQTLKAIEEAENYNGPSLIIAFVPCIAHGLKGGMHSAKEQADLAVSSGYWSLYRYQPWAKEKGKQPLILDYKRPKFDMLKDYLMLQQRFVALKSVNPEVAEQLYEKTAQQAIHRFFHYASLAGSEEKLRKKLLKEG